ncbi:class I SAM-dependent DNA methyltransferase [Bradyrhizobium liaoningense]|uniref:class I SAM-dependent DNA methyltransferase n=1 Tax=Bradyrhizobium liaoningense TaxID=43992 RepID=UPI001BABD105|nr:class I SAM-dependent DNA methyltransferase [Bradyrhizobium liaoningense]MBR0985186.1 class I SAM-dependent DNA methyltransferase [Bradyrhizobium liaoningense]
MTPNDFIKKWKHVALTERAAAQSHFLDLCSLLGHEDPVSADPNGDWFTFEKGVTKTGGGSGFADVWKRNYFAWEYKKRKKNLDDAVAQLVRYASALENPPLQVACDTNRIVIRTAWTNTVPKTYELALEQLADPTKLDILRAVFFAPEKLRPSETRAGITKDAADKFSAIALRLEGMGTPEQVAHFVNQLVFCFFANSRDIRLLPEGLLPKLLDRAAKAPTRSKEYFDRFFSAMQTGGEFDLTDIVCFNGGLFDGRRALQLDSGDVALLQAAAALDWSQIDPTIFGTLFERFLDPTKRSQIGAHYTDIEKILLIIEPVVLEPLREEWGVTRLEIEGLLLGAIKPPMRAKSRRRMTTHEAAEEVRSRYLERLRKVTILDPACGSGNFLYLALQGVKDIENRVNLECESLGLAPRALMVGPEIVHGIELNPVAAELARTTIWIGDIQWRRRNAIYSEPPPILRRLESIECRDAILDKSRRAPALWPPAEFIVGNPPFLGGKLLRSGLGDDYVTDLFAAYRGRVQPEADLVSYWFEKAREQLSLGQSRRVGLVSTNSIRGGANRRVLDKILEVDEIFEAWSDEPWIVEGAAVRVSLICFGVGSHEKAFLDGKLVSQVNADLTSGTLDLTRAKRLDENLGCAYMGDTKGGAFDVPGELARAWLALPANPNGRPNSDVLRPWRNGQDVVRRPSDKWIIDFGFDMTEKEASLYEAPFQHIKEHVFPERSANRREAYRLRWWRHVEPRPALVKKLSRLARFIVTPTVAKHRVFVWLDRAILPDHQLIAIARDDYTTFGILHSRFHELWSLRLGTWLGVGNDPRYTPTTTFETYPFPEGLTPNVSANSYVDDVNAQAIARAAQHLDVLRAAWLNPSDITVSEREVVAGFPARILPKDSSALATLRERTLTKLYNSRPQWLIDAHRDLDAAVAAAYGWSQEISDEDALSELLGLNVARSGVPPVVPGKPHVIGRASFAKINEVEGVVLSDSMKSVFREVDREHETAEERRRAIKRKLKQITP